MLRDRISGKKCGEIKSFLQDDAVHLVVGYGLQAKVFPNLDPNLHMVPSGKKSGKNRFDFSQDFILGEAMPDG